ncbi:alpha/beta fold hydrolase [Thiomicrorhabdus aquaedulcis]|nr:alpha/beta hydrolase [Thiomicrorhabdus aquaedulcis]
MGKYMQKSLPNATLKLIEAHGHCLHMTKPEAVSSALKTFMGPP